MNLARDSCEAIPFRGSPRSDGSNSGDVITGPITIAGIPQWQLPYHSRTKQQLQGETTYPYEANFGYTGK